MVTRAFETEPDSETAPFENEEVRPLIGGSRAFQQLLQQVETVADTGATVLVQGETGTGKELVARALHRSSRGSTGPFVALNCAAIPASLLESELFGHERGAFTGALARRLGRFELAHGGTLFLDEIGELAPELQPKLLRVLQERRFERVGGSATICSSARVVAATHRDLGAMVDAGTFREDLYYRLNVFPIRVPPLRERRDDIRPLALAFVAECAARANKTIGGLSERALDRLEQHEWPGNARELRNVIERAVILAQGDVIEDVSWDEPRRTKSAPSVQNDTLEAIERDHILYVLRKANWVVSGSHGAAARLGLARSTLNFRMKKLGIVRCTSG